MAPRRFTKGRLLALLSVVFFGLTSLFAVLELVPLVAPTFVLGFFIVVPLVAILGDDLSMVESEDATEKASDPARHTSRTPPDTGTGTGTSAESDDQSDDPVAQLRERYARGDIGDTEFERRLERLLETEDLEGVVDAGGSPEGRLDRELEREREAGRE